jgi:hypothetical protein
MLAATSDLSELLEPLSIVLSMSKKARKIIYNCIHDARLNFDEEYEGYIHNLPESKKKDMPLIEEVAMYKKKIRYYEEKILTKNIYPINDLDNIHKSYFPGSKDMNLEEFKKFYFENNASKNAEIINKKLVALNDLLYETQVEKIDEQEFGQKLRFCLNYGNKLGLRNYARMLKNAVSQLTKGYPVCFIGIFYVLSQNNKLKE